ncbi:MAG: polysaccharide deacetylase family protein [Rhizobacter sp.]|nr:polysaccharide deacetylase family protein [Chlorobiales bacterium]
MSDLVGLVIFIIATLAMLALIYAVVQFRFLIPPPRHGLVILMYHKLTAAAPDSLTIHAEMFARHLKFLKDENFTPVSFLQLLDHIKHQTPLPPKPVIITLDDGYQNNYDLAYPLLKRYGFKATIFLPVGFIGKTNVWDAGKQTVAGKNVAEKIMDYPLLRELAAEGLIEFGLHSFAHTDYRTMTPEQIDNDLRACLETLKENNCPFVPVFAYPYGGIPRDATLRTATESLFKKHGIELALRIKSRINRLPLENLYALTRTTVSGTDAFWKFKIQVHKGATKLF